MSKKDLHEIQDNLETERNAEVTKVGREEEKKPGKRATEKKKITEEQRRYARNGGYSLSLILFVFAIIVVFNVAVNLLPSAMTIFDMSENRIYELSDKTRTVLENLGEDVTLYTIASEGEDDEYMTGYAEIYASLSEHIHLERVDPEIDYSFLTEYSYDGYEGSILVVGSRWVCSECGYEVLSGERPTQCEECGSEDAVFTKKHRTVDISAVFYNEESDSTGEEATTKLDIEGQMTTAISYVSSDDTINVYYVTGHGEEESNAPSKNFANEVEKLDATFSYWDMSDTDELPEECDVLIINGPSTDYNDAETEHVLAYLENGGAAMILIRLNTTVGFSLPNFEKILAAYGVEYAGGGVMESDTRYSWSNQTYILSPVIGSHEITESLLAKDASLYLSLPDALEFADTVEGKPDLTVTPILTSSPNAYLKKAGSVVQVKTDSDESGTFNLGLAVANPGSDSENETRLVIFSTYLIMTDDGDDYVGGGNYELLVNSISWLAGQEYNISVPMLSVQPDSLILTSADLNRTAALVIIVIPVVILAGGFVIWQKRRMK